MTNLAMEPLLRDAWYVGAWSHELDDGPVARKLLGEEVVMFRMKDGIAGALEDRCPHRGVRLSLGQTVDKGLQCGYHGMVFGCDGGCTDNPGEKLNPGFKVRSFPVVERQNFVWVWMGDPAKADESMIVDFPYHDQIGEWNFRYNRYDIAANYMFMIDNLMDLTHLGYVHLSTIGGHSDEQNEAELTTERTDNGAHYVRWMMGSTPPPAFTQGGGFRGKIDRWGDFEYVAPASVLQWAGAHDAGTGGRENRNKPGGLVFRLFHQATPADDSSFHYFFSTAVRGKAKDDPANIAFHKANMEAFLEDKLFMESQQEIVSQDPSRALMLRTHDKAVAYARQAMHRLQERQLPAAAE